MRAAIAGDIIGSRFERSVWRGDTFAAAVCAGYDVPDPHTDARGETGAGFEPFHPACFPTDDTILTLAMIDWLLSGGDVRTHLVEHFRRAPRPALFGKVFRAWAAAGGVGPCGSVGNGAAMRVAPVAFAADDEAGVLELARTSARATHGDGEPVAGAEALALGVFLARTGVPRPEIAARVAGRFGYDLTAPLDGARGRPFTSACGVTVPAAFRAFLEAEDYLGAVRRAVSVGGDADTVACMAGALAGAYWGVPAGAAAAARERLDGPQRALLEAFERRFPAALRVVGG
jgi:ADP-ribosylglycohydrolase